MIIVGGGVIGTAHAYQALKNGHEVVHIERDAEARSASVRNFGLIWVSGRRSGVEFQASLRARELWEEIHHQVPAMSFRPNGSLTLATNEAEVIVMEECLRKEDAIQRQWQILDKTETMKLNPVLKGNYLASLWCPLDATVEPGTVLRDLREHLLKNNKYTWRNNVEVIEINSSSSGVQVIARSGEVFEADFLIHCPGADHSSIFKDKFDVAPIRKVRLQMMSTAALSEKLTTSIADSDSCVTTQPMK